SVYLQSIHGSTTTYVIREKLLSTNVYYLLSGMSTGKDSFIAEWPIVCARFVAEDRSVQSLSYGRDSPRLIRQRRARNLLDHFLRVEALDISCATPKTLRNLRCLNRSRTSCLQSLNLIVA